MKNILTIGKVLRARGLKGEFKVELYTSNPSRFAKVKSFNIDGISYNAESVKPEGEFAYVKLVGIDTAEEAEMLRNKSVSVSREQLPPPPTGVHYIVDVLGCDVMVDGDIIGELVDVLQYGSADVYVVKPLNGNGTISFPALKELIRETDIEKGIMTLDGYLFRRVAVINN